jgi:hypothetical protein
MSGMKQCPSTLAQRGVIHLCVYWADYQALYRVFKTKHQAVSQGVRRFESAVRFAADEHLQKPPNAGSRP